MVKTKIFTDIEALLTLKGAAQKDGRKICEEDLSILSEAAFVVERDLIVWIGNKKEIPSKYKKQSQKISLRGKTVLPAFVEAHTHLLFAGNRSDEFEMRNQGASYQEIAARGGGIISTVKKTRQAKLTDLVKEGQKRLDRYIQQGVATVEIKSGYALDSANEIKLLLAMKELKGARVVKTYLGAHAVPPEFSSTDQYIDFLIDEMLPKVAKKKLADRADIFIEDKYFTIEQSKRYFLKAKELGLGLVAHADQLTRMGGAALGVDMNVQSVDHVVQITEEDIQNLSRSSVTSVLLPGADYYLRMAYPPARRLIDAGAKVALATDYNPGTCPTQDVSFIGNLARLYMHMSLPEVIVAYTFNAASALGLSNKIGSIEVGKKADFILLDGKWTDLFYKVGEMPVVATYCEGKQVS